MEKRRLMLGEQVHDLSTVLFRSAPSISWSERRPDPAPYVEAIRPPAALLALVADTFGHEGLDRELRARELRFLDACFDRPVRRVYPHREATARGSLQVIRQRPGFVEHPEIQSLLA